MSIQIIQWEYIGKEKSLWEGTTTGMFCHVRFVIAETGKTENEYYVTTGYKPIQGAICIGIENAKTKAETLLNSYIFSIALP